MIGTSRSRSRSSDRMFGHVESTRSLFSAQLRRLANSLPPTPCKPSCLTKKKAGGNVKVSDADALALLRRIAAGESISNVARSALVSENTLRQWHDGSNRPTLARQIERECAA